MLVVKGAVLRSFGWRTWKKEEEERQVGGRAGLVVWGADFVGSCCS